MTVPVPRHCAANSAMHSVDGIDTHVLSAGSGPPLVLLHSGEFGSSAALSWEYTFAGLAKHFTVFAPDWLGFGKTAKLHDFGDYRGRKIRHMSRVVQELGIEEAPFIGNSMGANFLMRDAGGDSPMLPATHVVAISGGGPVPMNDARSALLDYDCSYDGMRRVVDALFHDPRWSADDAYVGRRHESSLVPGAWECSAAARFRSPAAEQVAREGKRFEAPVGSFDAPVLLVAGADDKLKPRGYERELAASIPGAESAEIENAGHCPHIEMPETVDEVILDFLKRHG